MASVYSHILDPLTQTHSSVRSNQGEVYSSLPATLLKSTQTGGVFESFVHREINLNTQNASAAEKIKAYKTPFQKEEDQANESLTGHKIINKHKFVGTLQTIFTGLTENEQNQTKQQQKQKKTTKKSNKKIIQK